MSVEFGGGSTGDDRMAEALRDAGRHVFAYLYETYAARLFDFCAGILDDEVAATVAVQDSLVTVDSKIAKLPDPDHLRVQLYSAAHRQCQYMSSRGRVRGQQGSETSAPDAYAAGQAGRADADGAPVPIVAAALSALTKRDQEVLNLAFRHGIEGADLAAVLGVSPRRARAMLSEAGNKFRRAAARCAGEGSDQVAGPEMLAQVPMATPPLTLRLRLTRTALALGSSRNGRAGGPGDAGGDRVAPSRPRPASGHGLPRVVVVSSLGLIILAVPGVMLYKLADGSGPGAAVAARIGAGLQSPGLTSAPPSLVGFDPRGSVSQHGRPPLPGLGPAPLGVVPTPSALGSPPTSAPPTTSQPTSPAPTTAQPTTSQPTTSPPTTAPTTPPPTTPPPTTPPPTTPPPTTPPPTTPPPTTPPPTTAPPTTPPTTAAATPSA
jgi:DNA-directed RNA polymerase specialized sigma24 family protein